MFKFKLAEWFQVGFTSLYTEAIDMVLVFSQDIHFSKLLRLGCVRVQSCFAPHLFNVKDTENGIYLIFI